MTHSEAERELIDQIMWGEKYLSVDITYVMDGEPLDALLRLVTERRDDAARDWLRPFVKRFIEGETGQKLVDSFLADERSRQELSVLEDRARLLYQEA